MAKDNESDIPRERTEPRPDFSKPIAPKKLPQELQESLDNEEKLWEALYEGHAPESTDSNLRYAAYATRIRTILLSAHRYVAYTSDIGESFRPIAHPYLVKGAYGVSWAYLIGDVANEGYKAYLRNQRVRNPEIATPPVDADNTPSKTQDLVRKIAPGIAEARELQTTSLAPGVVPAIEDYRAVMAQRAVFQSIASMGLPAFTIHSIVKYSGKALKDAKNKTIRTWGPIGLGLSAVPFLPYMFDEPVEQVVEYVFHKGFSTFGGPEAVKGHPVVGQQDKRQRESIRDAVKEKEL